MRVLPVALFIAVGIICYQPHAVAQGTAFEPLNIGVNPEAGAMGDTHVATADDAYAPFWNPAGLASNPKNTAAVAHHIWVGTSRTYALASQIALSNVVSGGVFILASGIGLTSATDGSTISGENVESIVAGIAISRRVGPLKAGFSGKLLSERIIATPSRGFAVDFGLQAASSDESFRVGVSLLNVGRMSEVSAIITELPTTLRAGLAVYPFRVISYDDAEDLLNAHFAFEVSRILPEDQTRIHFGVAAQVLELVTGRAGFVTNDDLRGFTAGLGLDVAPLRFDYALVQFSQGFGGPGHQLSLLYSW
ncbi:MAG: hypothetical protein HKN13_11480 [Rhodothermales bacterium]|nr:hypothetical protein [Rhodothermales bacterium]